MPPVATPGTFTLADSRRFTLAEYQRLIAADILTEEDRVELLEGHVVEYEPHSPEHDSTVTKLHRRFTRMSPDGTLTRCKMGLWLMDSQPEPDIAVARGGEHTFDAHHPQPDEIALVIEVADSSLLRDRTDKGRIYARVSIPQYWVVNLVDRQVEVFTDPTGPVSVPVYRRRQDYTPGKSVPVELDGQAVGSVSVDELLP